MAIKTGIYKITSPSKNIYIGQSINVHARFNHYKNLHCKDQPRLYNSIKKHGWSKHKFEIIHQCSPDELNELEKYYVNLFQTFNSKHGMNLRDGGGQKGKMSEETKNRIRDSHKGKVFTEEHKRNIGMSRKGKPSSRKGVKCSKSTIEKMRMANLGKKYSSEVNAKKGSKLEKNGAYGSGNKILQYDLSGNFIKEFISGSEINRELGFEGSNIIKYCRKGKEIIYGYKWKLKI